MVEHRGQWVKIVGPKAPDAAHQFQGGPHMLANRFIADYAITEDECLLRLDRRRGARADMG